MRENVIDIIILNRFVLIFFLMVGTYKYIYLITRKRKVAIFASIFSIQLNFIWGSQIFTDRIAFFMLFPYLIYIVKKIVNLNRRRDFLIFALISFTFVYDITNFLNVLIILVGFLLIDIF
jgi:hypothetical protein